MGPQRQIRLSHFHCHFKGFLLAQAVLHLPAMWKTWVPSLGWEDPLEKEMAIPCSTPAWKIPWMQEPGKLQSMGSLLLLEKCKSKPQ